MPDGDQQRVAQQFTATALAIYWQLLQRDAPGTLEFPPPPIVAHTDLAEKVYSLQAAAVGRIAAQLEPVAAGYFLGEIYTSLLPDELRARHGIYYTPPALTRRLLTLATEAGVDWSSCRVLDPACGGGAFLTPVALKMIDSLPGAPPLQLYRHLSYRLRGAEIDPFSAWMSQTLLEATLRDLCHQVGRRLPQLVTVCDSLQHEFEEGAFDLVIGNPPYGRVTLSRELREWYRRSLYGHANLYGLFTDLAIRWTKPGGVIAYLTPTSFLGGEYFKSLRNLLAAEAAPVAIDLIVDRKGIFPDVLQETLLAAYRRDSRVHPSPVHLLITDGESSVAAIPAGSFQLPDDAQAPWLLPRRLGQQHLIARLRAMPHRLSSYGYAVSTGPLVWNRHKPQLRSHCAENSYPLIWAEAVTSDGQFIFRAMKKNHEPYFEVQRGDDWLLTRERCLLLQRTTAKEQSRRLIAAELPPSFLHEHSAVVIENHLNVIRPAGPEPLVSTTVLATLLNSEVVDEAFRCISGSVAVSAFELESLPLPDPAALAGVEALLRAGTEKRRVDDAIRALYYYEGP